MIGALQLILVLVPLAVIVLAAAGWSGAATRRGAAGPANPTPWITAIALGVIALLLGSALAMAIVQVNAGQRGVILQFGATTERVLQPGIHIVTPFVNSAEKMSVQVQAYEARASAASKDLQEVSTTVTLNYALDPSKVVTVWRTLGREYPSRIIAPAVQESIKATTAQFDAEKLIQDRPNVKLTIEDSLRKRLAEHGIFVDTLSITDFQFSKVFIESVEAKVAVAQDALKAENKLRQIQVEAQQNAAQAEGDKNARILRAAGEASAILTVASAQAEANKAVNQTLTEDVIRYALVQKLGPDIKVIVLPNGQNFLLGPDILGGGTATPTPTPRR